MNTISIRLQQVLAQIENAASTSYKKSSEIKLLAVSKTKPVEEIEKLYALGQRQFGENYLQEAVDKIVYLNDKPAYNEIEWHFIGPIQSNKTRPIAEHFDWVQSVERMKIAQRLSDQRPVDKGDLNVCIQVNISAETSKSGTDIAQARELATHIAQLPNLKLRGIMAIPEKTGDLDKLTAQFKQLEALYLSLKDQYQGIDTLSMGMTNDMAIAIENGSTMVRVGSALFGERNK